MSGDITPDEDVNTKTPTMLDESKSDRSLPDIPPPPKPVKVTGAVPENERDLEKYYCEYCKDGVKHKRWCETTYRQCTFQTP